MCRNCTVVGLAPSALGVSNLVEIANSPLLARVCLPSLTGLLRLLDAKTSGVAPGGAE